MLIALCGAVALHLALVAMRVSVEPPEHELPTTINISLQEEKPAEVLEPPVQNDLPEEVEQDLSDQVVEPEDDIITERLIVAETTDSEQKQDQDKVQININSTEFKEFLRSETDLYRESNPESISQFGSTFEPTKDEPTVTTGNARESSAQISQNGVGMSIDKNGKRTCYAQIPDLLSDVPGSTATLSGPCANAPPKKFILDLNKPRAN